MEDHLNMIIIPNKRDFNAVLVKLKQVNPYVLHERKNISKLHEIQ